MSRIAEAFAHGKAFIPFLTCADPDLETTEAAVRAMAQAGADLIELGIPFSDPTAEGPVIQAANERALAGGVTTDQIFDMVRRLRRDVTVPMVFMTYANVVFSYGTELPHCPHLRGPDRDDCPGGGGVPLLRLLSGRHRRADGDHHRRGPHGPSGQGGQSGDPLRHRLRDLHTGAGGRHGRRMGSAIVKLAGQYGRQAVPHIAAYVSSMKQGLVKTTAG